MCWVHMPAPYEPYQKPVPSPQQSRDAARRWGLAPDCVITRTRGLVPFKLHSLYGSAKWRTWGWVCWRGWKPSQADGFEVGWRDDQGEHRLPLADAVSVPFEDGRPVRSFPSYRGQRHFPGLYWSSTTCGHVGFESWLERDHAMLLDFTPEVTGLLSHLQRTRIGELRGQMRDLQAEWSEEGVQRITTENTTLKQRVRRLTSDNRTLDERLKAARSNLRFQDRRVTDLETQIADPSAGARQ